MIDLSVTIVNYNTKDLLKQCIKSIYNTTKEITFEIIVVDNASTDGSVEMLKKEFPDVKVIANKENLFFTRAHNQALRISKGRYLMILNSDTVILDGAFDKIVKFMDEHPECGACGPKLVGPDMKHQWSGEKFPTLLYAFFDVLLLNTIFPKNPVKSKRLQRTWNRNTTTEVDTVSGACMLVRKNVIDKVGILDENFLSYWEEIDWCKRIKDNGWKIFFISDAVIIHFWEISMNKHGKEKKERIFYNSMLYYYKKHFGSIISFLLKTILILFTKPVLKFLRKVKDIL